MRFTANEITWYKFPPCPFFYSALRASVALRAPARIWLVVIDFQNGEQLAYPSLFIYIPVLLLVILYSIIVIKLKTQAHPGEQSANTQQQRDRRNRNVLQMSIAIVTVFVLCWLPYSINSLIMWYQDTFTHLSCSFWIYDEVTIYMSNAYCAINPVICFMFSSNYRKALKRLMKCSFVQA